MNESTETELVEPPEPREPLEPLEPLEPFEPLDVALNVIGDRWTLLIVHRLLAGPGRFNELLTEVPGIAPNILTKRLRHLETSGVIVASAYSKKPVRMHYELTASGHDLALTVSNLRSWGAQRGGGHGARHVCGTELEFRPWCPHCESMVVPGEIVAAESAEMRPPAQQRRGGRGRSGGRSTEMVDWV
jgi:DNA-binding HxlR family transcriptional regulator